MSGFGFRILWYPKLHLTEQILHLLALGDCLHVFVREMFLPWSKCLMLESGECFLGVDTRCWSEDHKDVVGLMSPFVEMAGTNLLDNITA